MIHIKGLAQKFSCERKLSIFDLADFDRQKLLLEGQNSFWKVYTLENAWI